MSRIDRILLIALLTTVPFFLLSSDCNSVEGKVIATVNGVAIKEDALMAEVNKKLPLASYHAGISKQKFQKLRDQALQNLIEEELLYQEAKKQKLKVSGVELQQKVEMMKKGFSSEDSFYGQLAKTGLSKQQLLKRLKRYLMIQQILQREVIDKVVVTDVDLRTYYEANKAKFIVPERFRVRHILISVDPGAMAAGWKTGLKKAQQVYSRIIAGDDFATVAKELSADSTSRDLGGDIGWIHKGQLIPELEEAIEEMEPGEVSKPIRSIYGFHIVKLEGCQPEKQLSFEEVNQEALKKKLLKKRIEERRQEFLTNLKARANIHIFAL